MKIKHLILFCGISLILSVNFYQSYTLEEYSCIDIDKIDKFYQNKLCKDNVTEYLKMSHTCFRNDCENNCKDFYEDVTNNCAPIECLDFVYIALKNKEYIIKPITKCFDNINEADVTYICNSFFCRSFLNIFIMIFLIIIFIIYTLCYFTDCCEPENTPNPKHDIEKGTRNYILNKYRSCYECNCSIDETDFYIVFDNDGNMKTYHTVCYKCLDHTKLKKIKTSLNFINRNCHICSQSLLSDKIMIHTFNNSYDFIHPECYTKN